MEREDRKNDIAKPKRLTPEEVEKLTPQEQVAYYAEREAYLTEQETQTSTRPTMPGLLRRLGAENVKVDPDTE